MIARDRTEDGDKFWTSPLRHMVQQSSSHLWTCHIGNIHRKMIHHTSNRFKVKICVVCGDGDWGLWLSIKQKL